MSSSASEKAEKIEVRAGLALGFAPDIPHGAAEPVKKLGHPRARPTGPS